MLLGRFPSAGLLSRPETQGEISIIFAEICESVRKGDFVRFQKCLEENEEWLFSRGLHLVLGHRLRGMLWRGLSRRVFLITYQPPPDQRLAPWLDLNHVLVAATFQQHLIEDYTYNPSSQPQAVNPLSTLTHKPPNVSTIHLRAMYNSSNTSTQPSSTLVPPPSGPRQLLPSQGLIHGNMHVTAEDVEMEISALMSQGLLHGYIAKSLGKFAIMGAKAKGAVGAGWPRVWDVIRERRGEGEGFEWGEVMGWVKR